jgi:hypothetical protein
MMNHCALTNRVRYPCHTISIAVIRCNAHRAAPPAHQHTPADEPNPTTLGRQTPHTRSTPAALAPPQAATQTYTSLAHAVPGE